MKIKCIVIEDEPLATERVKGFIQKLPFLKLVAQFENGVDALVFLQLNVVDLIFLDINIGEFSGIQLLESARHSSEIIITTAYNEYALKGFELNVTDYLLKPYTFERFVQAVTRAQENLSKKELTTEKNFVFIKTAYRLEKISFSEILFIEGMRDYRKIHTSTKKIMTLQTFRELESEIPEHIICRVHKSYMVSIDKIDTIERNLIRIQDNEIPISETYKKHFFQMIIKQV
ncbi:MAG: LytR/AlgR family response regulator transcription factor [Chitinophagaceae bacterium]